MKILVTGGLGFMGSNLVRHLYETYPEDRIWNLDVITYAGNPENLADIEASEKLLAPDQKRYQFIRGDICDERLLDHLFKENRFDSVIHLAAETHVDRSIADTKNFIRTNVVGTHALLDMVRKYPVERFIHVSTDEVYGDMEDHEGGVAHERTAFRPSSPYSASKAAGDQLVQAYIRTYKTPAIILRPTNNFGPRQYPEKLIPLTITNALQNKNVPLHGTGEYVRSWLYVNDFSHGVDTLLHNGAPGEEYNIGGTPRTNKEIVHAILTTLEKDPAAHIKHVPDRPGQDKKYCVNWDKLRSQHSWEHSYQFEDALKETVRWYVQNVAWWQTVRATPGFKDYYREQIEGRGYE